MRSKLGARVPGGCRRLDPLSTRLKLIGGHRSYAAWSHHCLRPDFLQCLDVQLFEGPLVQYALSLHLKIRCLVPLMEVGTLGFTNRGSNAYGFVPIQLWSQLFQVNCVL